MMRWIVGSSLKFRRLLVAVAAGVLFFGVVQLAKAPVDALPEFKAPTVEIQTQALGLSAEEVEQLITVPMEQDLLAGVAFLDKMESASLPGLSSIVMTFEPGTDILDARQVVTERLTQVAGLPGVGNPPQMIQPLSSTSRVAMVRLSSDKLTPIQMSVLARWVISPRLLGVQGVADVYIWGQRERQLQVLLDPKRLSQKHVSVDQIVRTTGNALDVSPLSFLEASTPGTGGFIDTLNQRLQIFHEQAITTAKQLGEVPVENPEGSTVGGRSERLRLSDVATVVENHQPLTGDALCPGRECLLLVIEKFPSANTVKVTSDIDEALEAMRPGLGGMQIDSSIYRPAAYVESSASHLGTALLVGGILMLIVLGGMFFSWRTALISAIAIAISLAAAVLTLTLLGTTFNTMVIAGLVMGLVAVIDDAINDTEHIAERLRRHREEGHGAPAWRMVLDASLGMRRPILFATLILAAAVLPLFFMQGRAGAFLPPLAISFLIAVGLSMLVALTVTPALTLLLLGGRGAERRESPIESWIDRMHRRASSRTLHRPAVSVIAGAAVLVASLVALPFLNGSSSPSLRESELLVNLQAAPGTSLPRMDQVASRAVTEIRSLPGIRDVGAHVGRAFSRTDEIVNVNSGQIWVDLDSAADYDATIERIRDVAHRYEGGPEGIVATVGTYSEQQTASILDTSNDDLVVRLFGENEGVLRTKADEIRGVLARIDGVRRPTVVAGREEPNIELKVDLAAAHRYGVKPGDVRRTAAILLSGITVGNLFEQQKVFDVVVWGEPEIRRGETDVRNLPIDTPRGQVPLDRLADVRVVNNPAVIRHFGTSTYLDVTADVAGRDVGAVATDADRALKQVQFPLEYHAEVLGDYADRQAERNRLLAVSVAAALAIFLLLQAALASWRLAALALGTLVVAVSGALLAAWAAGGEITLGSVAGLLAVVGIAARQSVLLIRNYHSLEREGLPFGDELVVAGTRDRLLPMVTSALALTAVLLPLVFAGNTAGLEIVRPIAVVVLGGVLTATLVNLIITPALYLRFGFVDRREAAEDDLFEDLPDVEVGSDRGAEDLRR